MQYPVHFLLALSLFCHSPSVFNLFVALKLHFCFAAAGQRMGQLHQRGEPVLPCLHWHLQRQAVQQEAE